MSSLPSKGTATAVQPEETPEASSRLAFDLGWDHAFYGVPCYSEDPDVLAGFAAGQRRFGPRGEKSADRYQRKWLLLRTNAWRRQRVVSEAITPQYLQSIDTKRCPILGIELTHGTMQDTDWSIDRVNNDGAYAPGNLAVLSVLANRAKGALSFSEVLERSRRCADTDGLTSLQWLRLASLMAAPCLMSGEAAPIMPFLVMSTHDVPILFSQYLQSAFLLEVCGRQVHIFRPLRQAGGLELSDRLAFEALFKKIRKREARRPPLDEFWLHPALFLQFSAWYSALRPRSREYLKTVLSHRVAYENGFEITGWCLETLGFYRSALR